MIQNFWILLNLCCLISKECSKSVLLDSSQGRYSARSQFVLFASLENLYSSSARLLETGNHYVSQYFGVFTGIYGPICKCHLHTTPFALSPISSHSTSMLHCFFFPLATIHRGPSHCLSCHKKLRFPLITPVPSLKHLPVCFPVLYCGIILGGHSVVLIIETIAHPIPPDYSYVFICAFW